MRVAAGAIAQKILGSKIKIKGALIQIGKKKLIIKNGTGVKLIIMISFAQILQLFRNGKLI